VLFSSHVLTEVEAVCDRVGILQRGRLVHVQKLADLHESRLVRVRWSGPASPPPSLPGLTVREQAADRLILEMSGPLTLLLDWLARQPVEDLQVQPLGLNALYHRYHGATA
jgi:ABC-2 type transport system ATP-binding protein